MNIEEIATLRRQLWDSHPIITERAILPTPAFNDAIAKVWDASRRGRASIAFYAEPLTGKSSLSEMLAHELLRAKPGCNVLTFEMVEDKVQAEGRLLSEILNQIDYAPKISRDIAGKRTQVHRALLSLSGDARHLFLMFDEAQEIRGPEYAWLKSVVNRLVRDRVKVTVVLFGQVELKKSKAELQTARSDLERRFMSTLHELKGLRASADLTVPLRALDDGSEFPLGTGLTYTQLLLPRFFAGGGRILDWKDEIEKALKSLRRPGTRDVVSMAAFAGFLANLFIILRDDDDDNMTVPVNAIAKAAAG